MNKEFIPYNESLELKALGFDEPCFGYYSEGELILNSHTNNHMQRFRYSAPTFSQAFRWFREKYNLIFQINYLFNGNYQVVIHKNTYEYMVLIQDLKAACVYEIPDNYSYEEAELECLKKLIEIAKQK